MSATFEKSVHQLSSLMLFFPSVQGAYLNQTRRRIEQIYAGKSGRGYKQHSSLPDAWRGGGRLCQPWGPGKEHACLWGGGRLKRGCVLCRSFSSHTAAHKTAKYLLYVFCPTVPI